MKEGGEREYHVYGKKPGTKMIPREQRGLVVASIMAVLAWAVFIIIYALFWSTRFGIFQNVILTLASLFITGLIVGLIWVILGRNGTWHEE